MKKQALSALLALSLLLGGCANKPAAPDQTTAPQATQALATQPTQPPATVPPDGNPEDVTCKGSYTGQPAPEQVAAVMGEKQLTNGQLSASIGQRLRLGSSPARSQARTFRRRWTPSCAR